MYLSSLLDKGTPSIDKGMAKTIEILMLNKEKK